MEKKLFLLGMLESEGQICSYLMSEDLEGTSRVGLTISKANAHRLMSEMSKIGWVDIEPDGKQKKYAITDEGSRAFKELQKRRLAAFVTPAIPSAIALNHLHLMDPREASDCLSERAKSLEGHIAVLKQVPAAVRKSKKRGVDLLVRHYETELSYIQELKAVLLEGVEC